jgi:hypothetical protein
MHLYARRTHKILFYPEDGCLLGCSAVYTGMSLSMFQRSVLPPSSGPWVTHTSLYDATAHKTAILIVIAVRSSSHIFTLSQKNVIYRILFKYYLHIFFLFIRRLCFGHYCEGKGKMSSVKSPQASSVSYFPSFSSFSLTRSLTIPS